MRNGEAVNQLEIYLKKKQSENFEEKSKQYCVLVERLKTVEKENENMKLKIEEMSKL
jgi:hypothetical protein